MPFTPIHSSQDGGGAKNPVAGGSAALAPVPMRWTGDAMVPLKSYQRKADAQYVIGEVYTLVEEKQRSQATHNHEFAWLREAWQNLPEHLTDQFPSPEHLRKRALIDAGYYDEAIIDAGTKAAALRVAAFARSKDQFAAIVVRGPIVVVREAKSQNRRSMDAKEFAASKRAVLETVAAMIGVAPAALQRAEAA